MNPDFRAWPTQEPPPDFAARTARALIAERASLRTSQRRWVRPLGAFLLAALVCGGAWATYELSRGSIVEAGREEDLVAPPAARLVRVHIRQQAAGAPTPPKSPVGSPVPAITPASPRSAEPEGVPLAPSRPTPPAPQPSCDCGPGAVVCTCSD